MQIVYLVLCSNNCTGFFFELGLNFIARAAVATFFLSIYCGKIILTFWTKTKSVNRSNLLAEIIFPHENLKFNKKNCTNLFLFSFLSLFIVTHHPILIVHTRHIHRIHSQHRINKQYMARGDSSFIFIIYRVVSAYK